MTDEWDDQAKRDWLKWELDSTRDEWTRHEAQQQLVREERGHTSPNASETVARDRVQHVSSDPTLDTRGWGMGRGERTEWYYSEGELMSVELCWRCDAEAEYGGYCEAHWRDRLEEIADEEMLEHDEWVEDAYSREELERLQALEEERRDDH